MVSQSVEVTDKTLLYEPHKANLYMKGFLKNLYLRPSCYACPAKCGKSGADYTLADFGELVLTLETLMMIRD